MTSFFLPFRPLLSTVLSKFLNLATFFSSSFGCQPWRVSPGAVRPLTPSLVSSDATAILLDL